MATRRERWQMLRFAVGFAVVATGVWTALVASSAPTESLGAS